MIEWVNTELPAKQGDLMLIKVSALPEGFELEKPDDRGMYVVAHSENGAHHVIDAEDVEYYTSVKNKIIAYLVVKNAIGKCLEHLRTHDTHESILVNPGIYELRRQREYIPQGWRMIND